eukprot:CAMPEP_0119468460 /NCGR_PEP_ID=MMETSP1344-20130328/2205_1 /TAXON_ID=236787 /ORGANISM="Florenciella parvula, Strain CCMP2471" /LENGTH=241 /DNA_ID=CAMNT_0007500929 /DNA_START=230 /DNA_END=953 /DNA_ORIENTATION=+
MLPKNHAGTSVLPLWPLQCLRGALVSSVVYLAQDSGLRTRADVTAVYLAQDSGPRTRIRALGCTSVISVVYLAQDSGLRTQDCRHRIVPPDACEQLPSASPPTHVAAAGLPHEHGIEVLTFIPSETDRASNGGAPQRSLIRKRSVHLLDAATHTQGLRPKTSKALAHSAVARKTSVCMRRREVSMYTYNAQLSAHPPVSQVGQVGQVGRSFWLVWLGSPRSGWPVVLGSGKAEARGRNGVW